MIKTRLDDGRIVVINPSFIQYVALDEDEHQIQVFVLGLKEPLTVAHEMTDIFMSVVAATRLGSPPIVDLIEDHTDEVLSAIRDLGDELANLERNAW